MSQVYGGPLTEVSQSRWRLPFICFICRDFKFSRSFSVFHIKSMSDNCHTSICTQCAKDELTAYFLFKEKMDFSLKVKREIKLAVDTRKVSEGCVKDLQILVSKGQARFI